MAIRKNPTAYQVSRSAVKNTHSEKSGIERRRQALPNITAILLLFLYITMTTKNKKTMS